MFRSHLKMLMLSISVMFCHYAGADTYDPLLLRAQASIFPKIVQLDKNLAEKTLNDEIVLTIIAVSQDAAAQKLQNLIEEKYKKSLGNRRLTVNVVSFEDYNKKPLATAYIVLQGPELLFKDIISYASSHGRIVFSYSYTDFRHNALISLLVKEKTYIYLNKTAIQLYDIKFLPVFYKITKIIE